MRFALVPAVLLALLLGGCGLSIPSDPEGTLDRARDGVMRVGVTENPPWVELGETSSPSGTEVALIEQFAGRQDADVEWTTGSEATLLHALDRGEIDVVIGGFHDDTPWTDLGAITRPYVETDGPDGREKHVMIVRLGENRLLTELERFLFEEVGS
jgi:polar amino acid transport system substrate-binding protein